jgi:hypothetical protein
MIQSALEFAYTTAQISDSSVKMVCGGKYLSVRRLVDFTLGMRLHTLDHRQ